MKLSKKEIRNYVKRWEKVSSVEEEETKKMSPSKKFSMLASLVCMGTRLGLRKKHVGTNPEEVQLRWIMLKKGIQ